MASNMYMLQRELTFANERDKILNEYYESLKNQSISDQSSSTSNIEAGDELDQQIKELEEEVKAIELEKKEIQIRRQVNRQKLIKIQKLKEVLNEKSNQLKYNLENVIEKNKSLTEDYDTTYSNYNKVKQINGMNDTFYIWFAGPYATINTFRLGHLSYKPIDFTEINAALGQAALAIYIISNQAEVEFKYYNILPMGSFPKLMKLEDRKTTYPLFIDSTSFSLFPKRNFNLALTGFMTCIQEVGDFISNYDPTLTLPYRL